MNGNYINLEDSRKFQIEHIYFQGIVRMLFILPFQSIHMTTNESRAPHTFAPSTVDWIKVLISKLIFENGKFSTNKFALASSRFAFFVQQSLVNIIQHRLTLTSASLNHLQIDRFPSFIKLFYVIYVLDLCLVRALSPSFLTALALSSHKNNQLDMVVP